MQKHEWKHAYRDARRDSRADNQPIEPKRENMDGDQFLEWLWKVSQEITNRAASLGPYQDGREWAIAAFNCNYDPKAAAYEWLRRQLGDHPGA